MRSSREDSVRLESASWSTLVLALVVVVSLPTVSDAAAYGRRPSSADHPTRSVANSSSDGAVDRRTSLCSVTGRCCQGKDNTCRGGTRSAFNDVNVVGNWTTMGGDETDRCFCDSACLELGNCCTDYKQTCQAVDCVLADEWDDYGACDSRCGPGIRQRRRQIVQQPLNGGRPCGKTVEKIPCDGNTCKVARAPTGYEELRETGHIIPSVYGTWRKSKKYDPFSDIRRNLFERYDAMTLIKRPAYCMVFELTEVRSACKLASLSASAGTAAANWVGQLVKGQSVCVECQPSVMKKKLGGRCRGHGVQSKETRWDAVTVPGCRGRWVMRSRMEECQCSPTDDSSKGVQLPGFILI